MDFNLTTPTPPALSRTPLAKEAMKKLYEPYTAKNIFSQLVQRIKLFDMSLDHEHEVGMQLVSFGQSIQFSVLRLGYMDPSIIWFEGILPDGSNVQLLQHVNQISFLMVAVKRQNPEKPKAPIGFCRPDQKNE
jgi:hypothetical protein